MKSTVLTVRNLAEGLVLSPNRYSPSSATRPEGIELSTIVQFVRDTVAPDSSAIRGKRIRVLDTSHARGGFLDWSEPEADASPLGSTKKVIKTGDVIISRLRPYLKQVAFVDFPPDENVITCVSTEFYVLRTKSSDSIAFLVPWLLSSATQEILAASQEGGHHPRFNSQVLLSLQVPFEVIEQRHTLSQTVESACRAFRTAGALMSQAFDSVVIDLDAQ